MPFSPDFQNHLITIWEQIAGERKGQLKNVIRDCLNECEEASKGFDG